MLGELIADIFGTLLFEGLFSAARYVFFTDGFEAVPDDLRRDVADALVLAVLWDDDRIDDKERAYLAGALDKLQVSEPRVEQAIKESVERVSRALDEAGARALLGDLAAKLLDAKAREALAVALLLLQRERPGAEKFSFFDVVTDAWQWPPEQRQEARDKAEQEREKEREKASS